MTVPLSVLLIGCGKMGSSLLRGWKKPNSEPHLDIYIVDPHDPEPEVLPLVKEYYRILDSRILNTRSSFDTVVLAVKPQQLDSVLKELKPLISPKTLILSIAAGYTTARIYDHLHLEQPIIRAMPNLPASIGHGITGAYPNPFVTKSQHILATRLLCAIGELVWVDHETQIDAITALSGSGPAYLFLLTEILARTGEKIGLPPELAVQLARQTMIGASLMMDQSPNLPVSTLRQNVTSPNGTTAAALQILMNPDFNSGALQTLFDLALTAAYNRAQELNR